MGIVGGRGGVQGWKKQAPAAGHEKAAPSQGTKVVARETDLCYKGLWSKSKKVLKKCPKKSPQGK